MLIEMCCRACGNEVNSWDKRCSAALGYQHIVCEKCIAREYDKTVAEVRGIMEDFFGMRPCQGI